MATLSSSFSSSASSLLPRVPLQQQLKSTRIKRHQCYRATKKKSTTTALPLRVEKGSDRSGGGEKSTRVLSLRAKKEKWYQLPVNPCQARQQRLAHDRPRSVGLRYLSGIYCLLVILISLRYILFIGDIDISQVYIVYW
jgi:hypothetical protein